MDNRVKGQWAWRVARSTTNGSADAALYAARSKASRGESLSEREAAIVLGISRRAVRIREQRALHKIRMGLESAQPDNLRAAVTKAAGRTTP